MRVSVVGTGYVGLVTGTCFAEMGNDIWCVDTNESKIENLKKGIIPIYEPGLEEMVQRNYNVGHLHFTTSIQEALAETTICFIAVGTPMGEDGSADLQYVLSVAENIGEYMVQDMIVVDKSTVPIGTADKVAATIQSVLDRRGVSYHFHVVSNPEFLKEGTAIEDSMRPDRVVLGVPDSETEHLLKELYSPFIRNNDRFIVMDVKSAEMTKYAANCMLATRISFMNEIANLCEKVGADINKVRLGIGSDSRIGYSFLYAGCGYGGSCFPKDVRALIKIAQENGISSNILEQVEAVNAHQKQVLVEKIIKQFGEDLTGRVFGVWGLAFKPNTDDMRDAPSIVIITELIRRGATIKAYDPQAVREANFYLKDFSDKIEYTQSKYTALNGVDAMLLITEWKEFRSPDFDEMRQRMRQAVIIDGRNQYNAQKVFAKGFIYEQVGVGKSTENKTT